jgi:hypothetical protein
MAARALLTLRWLPRFRFKRTGRQGLQQRLFGSGQRVLALPSARDAVAAVVVADHKTLLDRKADEGGGEALIVKTLFPDVAHACRPQALRRAEQRHDRPARRITAHPVPGEDIVGSDAQHGEAQQEVAHVVHDPPPALLCRGGRRDDALLPGHRNGEAFSGLEATRGFGGKNVAASSGHTRVLAVLAKAACVHGVLSGFRARSGSRMIACACSIGKVQPLPVAFQ